MDTTQNVMGTQRTHDGGARMFSNVTQPQVEELLLLLARSCTAQAVVVWFADAMRPWVLARWGLGASAVSLARMLLYETLRGRDIVEVRDARLGSQVRPIPLVRAPGGVRSYAGIALRLPNGRPVGTIAVLDNAPRVFGPEELRALRIAASAVLTRVHAVDASRDLPESAEDLSASNDLADVRPDECETGQIPAHS